MVQLMEWELPMVSKWRSLWQSPLLWLLDLARASLLLLASLLGFALVLVFALVWHLVAGLLSLMATLWGWVVHRRFATGAGM
jgi:hypothetical protein